MTPLGTSFFSVNTQRERKMKKKSNQRCRAKWTGNWWIKLWESWGTDLQHRLLPLYSFAKKLPELSFCQIKSSASVAFCTFFGRNKQICLLSQPNFCYLFNFKFLDTVGILSTFVWKVPKYKTSLPYVIREKFRF